jgi:hypothetical protein
LRRKDIERGEVNIKGTKKGRNRIIKLESNIITKIRTYIHKHNFGMYDDVN